MDETNLEKSRSKLGTMVSYPSLHRNSTLREELLVFGSTIS